VLAALPGRNTHSQGWCKKGEQRFIIIPRTASPPSSSPHVLMDADVRDATTISLISLLTRLVCSNIRVEFRREEFALVLLYHGAAFLVLYVYTFEWCVCG
jgi:hypothetical protein